jgi:hypothetical protein
VSPAWALVGGGAFPQPLRPPLLGLVQWTKGDADLIVAATRVTDWADQSGMGQNFEQSNATLQPYDLGDSIDGIPCISFGAAGDANKEMTTAANFVDRTSTPMDGASARTVIAMIKPRFDAAWGVTGGPIWQQSNWQALFDLESSDVPDGAYAWSRAWRDFTSAMAFGPVTGGALGPYNGVPTLIQFSSPGSPAGVFYLNNVLTALTPATMPGAAGGVGVATISTDTGIALLGALSEVLVWDYDLTTDAAAQTQAVNYMVSRYPSAPIVI